jgi:threonine dehydrogenase-like Zn-dependent dehydrogenase
VCARRPARNVVSGGTVLVFSPAATVDLDEVYRRELTLAGSRSATPRHMGEAAELLSELEVPAPTVLPLERFGEGLELYRSGAALKVVFTP